MKENTMAAAKTAKSKKPETIKVTVEQVHDVLADAKVSSYRGQPEVIGIYDIVTVVLGHDPLRGKNTDSNFGGRSKDAWINEHLSMSHLRKVLDQMIDDGQVVKLTEPSTYSRNAEDRLLHRAVSFPYRLKTGYMLAERFAEAVRGAEADDRNARRVKLVQAAQAAIAEKYDAEVQAAYAELCAAENLDPQREQTAASEAVAAEESRLARRRELSADDFDDED